MYLSSIQMNEAMISLTQELGNDLPWLLGIRIDHDDAGPFIEVKVNDKYPSEDPLSRRYKGVPLIIMRHPTLPKVKN